MTALGTVPDHDDPAPIPLLDLRGVHAGARADLDAVWSTVLAHGRYVGGPELDEFEDRFAAYCEARACVGVGNGTDALELVLRAIGVGAGDEVVVPANTFAATAEAVCAVGGTPRFVDVSPDTLLVDPAAVAAEVGPRTAAVVAVHLFGQMADVDALGRLAAREGLALVEDAAQAHGARFAGRRAGGAGLAAAFSFYPGKNLGALGDGGAVVSDDVGLVERVRRLADHGRSAGDRHRHEVAGRNSRLDTLQAGVLSARLRTLDAENAARARVVDRYRERLPDGFRLVGADPRAECVHHLAVVETDDRDRATAALSAARIGWGIHYPVPCHRQPAFAAPGLRRPVLPVSERAADRILSLPCSPTTTDAEVDRVAAVLREVVR
ncbi:DegT/DnrJ/EryC1/StrS family aminotransferase [Actinomycetospora sp. CA-101289]|uniref:DegT/DnrJ/EryC1/StrS family aminotransferase n=1 Tax=Actinomycetospora sp. CA-101289 TaxID=3239893 RepID=UPI003D982341